MVAHSMEDIWKIADNIAMVGNSMEDIWKIDYNIDIVANSMKDIWKIDDNIDMVANSMEDIWKIADSIAMVHIQSYTDDNDTKSYYEAPKGVNGQIRFYLHLVRSIEGALIHNKDMILARWAKYEQSMLNKVHATEQAFLDDLPTQLIIPNLDDPPSLDKVKKAILSLNDNKAACPDNIPPEVFKYGGCALHQRLSLLSVTPSLPIVYHSNGNMPTLTLYTNRMWQQSWHHPSVCGRQSAGQNHAHLSPETCRSRLA